jgi:hypothetical protein
MKQPSRPSNFSRPQLAVLIVAGTLGMFWILLAAVFVLSTGFTNPSAEVLAGENPEPIATLLSPTHTSAAQVVTIPQITPIPPTACAQQNSGVLLAPAALVLDDGTIEVQVEDGVLHVVLASTHLPQDALLLDQTIQKARELITGQDILLVKDRSEQDDSGRLVRYVFAGGQFVNYELVRQGLANAVLDSPDLACAVLLRQAEQQARGDELGMWSPLPVPTATFMPFVTLDPQQAACDCSKRYQCSDFNSRAAAQVCYNACNDYHSRLDLDRDGLACEGLP